MVEPARLPPPGAAESRAASLRRWLVAARLDLRLQLGRQERLAFCVDALLVGLGLLDALAAVDATASGLYALSVLMPLLVLAVPVLADTVALERRAGCLELALMSPRRERYFLRRAAIVTGWFALQGTLLMLLDWSLSSAGFPLLPVLTQLVAVHALVGATTMFWSGRLASAGSVWLAALVTLLAAGPWTLWSPVVVPMPGEPLRGALLPATSDLGEWAAHTVPVATAALLLFLYARRRLRASEPMLRGAG